MLPFFGEREEAWLPGRHGNIAMDCVAPRGCGLLRSAGPSGFRLGRWTSTDSAGAVCDCKLPERIC